MRGRPSGPPIAVGGLLVLILSLFITSSGIAESRAEPRPIRTIAIVSLPVFPETTGTPLPWYLRLANRLHRDTRPSVIRQEILLHEGTPYDVLRASESERLLRGRGIFESVRVTSREAEGGYVTTVRTQDLWTLGIDFTVQKVANLSSATLGIRDTNILGTGNGIRWAQTFSSDRSGSVLSFEVPRIGYSRASAGASYAQTKDVISRFAAFSHPVETYFDRWSWDVAISNVGGNQRFFRSGIESGSSGYNREHGVVSIGRYGGLIRQGGFGAGWILDRTSQRGIPRSFIQGVPPPPVAEYLRVSGPLVFAGISQRRFIRSTNLQRYGTVEDVPLGWVVSLAAAANARASTDPVHTFVIRPVVSGATILGNPAWVASAAAVGLAFVRRSGTGEERVLRGNVTLRWQPDPKALSVAQVAFHAATGQPPGDIFYLGTDTGLRGYPARALEAREFVLGTIEQRYWSGVEVLWVGIGGNLFTDVARPTTTTGPNDASWRVGVGGGLLLGLRKSAQAPIRIEVAWRRDRSGERPTFSITSDSWLQLIPQVSLPTLFRDLHEGLR